MARKVKRGRPVKVAPEIDREIKLFVQGCDSLDGETFYRKVSTETQREIALSAIKQGLMEKGTTVKGKRVALLTEEGKELYQRIEDASD